jgi:hypothetical protein
MLERLDEGLWTAQAPFAPSGIQVGARTTLVRSDGGLVAISPLPWSDALGREIAELGPVRALVAPNKHHHLFLEDWVRAFPAAKLLGPPGLAEKRRDLRFDAALGSDAARAFTDGIEHHLVAGAPFVNEVAFLHRASGTLVVTDLAMCIRGPVNLRTRAFLAYGRCHGRLRTPVSVRACVRDRRALRASVDRLLAWDFERVVVAHGEVLERGGPAAFREALDWL